MDKDRLQLHSDTDLVLNQLITRSIAPGRALTADWVRKKQSRERDENGYRTE